MEGTRDYKAWCDAKGYKASNAKALMKYYSETKLQKTRLIKSKMSLTGDTFDSLGKYLGLSRQTTALKVNGDADFNQTELTLLKIRFNLTDEEFIQIATKEIVNNEHSRSSEAVK